MLLILAIKDSLSVFSCNLYCFHSWRLVISLLILSYQACSPCALITFNHSYDKPRGLRSFCPSHCFSLLISLVVILQALLKLAPAVFNRGYHALTYFSEVDDPREKWIGTAEGDDSEGDKRTAQHFVMGCFLPKWFQGERTVNVLDKHSTEA